MAENEASLLLRLRETGGEILDHFVVTLGEVYEAVKKVAEFLASFVEAYAKQEEAVNALSASMVQQGIYSTELKDKYLEMAEALGKTTIYSNEQIISAQGVLQSMVGQREVTESLMKATMDLAAKKKMDLVSAAELVGKAVSNENNVLQRQGIQYEITSDKGERLARVTEAIEQKFHGAAEAQALGLGVLKQMENAWEELKETIGSKFAPTVEVVALIMRDFFSSLKTGSPVLDGIALATKEVIEQMVLFARDVQVVGQVAGNVFGGLFGAFKAAAAGDFTGAWQQIKAIVTVSLDDIVAANEAASAKIKAIHDSDANAAQAKLLKEEADIQASNERKIQMASEVDLQAAQKELERQVQQQDRFTTEQEMMAMNEEGKLRTLIKMYDQQISAATSYQAKKALVEQRGNFQEQLRDEIKHKQKLDQEAYFQKQHSDMIAAGADLITAIADDGSKAVFLIQKGAALAETYIATQVASAQALASIPYPANLAAAANIEIIGYIKMAAIGATAIKGLADGGVVPASPGGGLYRIGEGGRDEAVIPLDDPSTQQRLGMGGVTVIFQGPLLGDGPQAQEFAREIDRQLYKLRQTNQSIAFDTSLS